MLDLSFELQSEVYFWIQNLMRPKPRIHNSHLPCFGASWWLIPFFAGSFRLIQNKISSSLGFYLKFQDPMGPLVQIQDVVQVLRQQSHKWYIDHPSCWEDLDIQKTALCYTRKKAKATTKSISQQVNSTTNPGDEEEHVCTLILKTTYSTFEFSMFLLFQFHHPDLLLPAFQTSQISGRPTVHRHGHPVEHWEGRHHYLKSSATSDGKWWYDLSQRFPAKQKTNMEPEKTIFPWKWKIIFHPTPFFGDSKS